MLTIPFLRLKIGQVVTVHNGSEVFTDVLIGIKDNHYLSFSHHSDIDYSAKAVRIE